MTTIGLRRALWPSVVAVAFMLSPGCSESVDPGTGAVVVTGKLVKIEDQRSFDGGIILTVETGPRRRVLQVPSIFGHVPEEVHAVHRVVDRATLGDRLRADVRRDPAGALIVERLEILE